jgi:hypothetical protein
MMRWAGLVVKWDGTFAEREKVVGNGRHAVIIRHGWSRMAARKKQGLGQPLRAASAAAKTWRDVVIVVFEAVSLWVV